MMHARAILWAHWRTVCNFYPRGGVAWTALIGFLWYGFWLAASAAVARVFADPANVPMMRVTLPGALLLVFLYWQVVPLLMAATGAALELRKLLVYPIPDTQLFSIEAMLRVTAAIEMVLMLLGVSVAVMVNARLRKWGLAAVAGYALFNLCLAVGLRDLVARLLARKRVREVAFMLLVIFAALPQMLLTRSAGAEARMRSIMLRDSWAGWPWTAAANLIAGRRLLAPAGVLLAWTAAAALFGRWQFARTLSFDAQAAGAGDSRSAGGQGFFEGFFRIPSALFADPLAALIEKEIRSLLRSPRFRLVFLMGFTFGLVIWLPISIGRRSLPSTFLGSNYLTVVSVYSVLLLSEVCFWNSFGFDRSAAQIYFLAPVPFSRVLIGKNLSSLFFIFLEISAVTMVCAFLGLPLNPQRMAEAYSVAGVISVFLMGAGNLMSVHQARAVNPARSFRSNAAGRLQAMLFAIYAVAFLPIALAYLARYAFDSQAAFFVVLAIDAAIGLAIYRVALDSAVEAAGRIREKMIAALSTGDGPIGG